MGGGGRIWHCLKSYCVSLCPCLGTEEKDVSILLVSPFIFRQITLWGDSGWGLQITNYIAQCKYVPNWSPGTLFLQFQFYFSDDQSCDEFPVWVTDSWDSHYCSSVFHTWSHYGNSNQQVHLSPTTEGQFILQIQMFNQRESSNETWAGSFWNKIV